MATHGNNVSASLNWIKVGSSTHEHKLRTRQNYRDSKIEPRRDPEGDIGRRGGEAIVGVPNKNFE